MFETRQIISYMIFMDDFKVLNELSLSLDGKVCWYRELHNSCPINPVDTDPEILHLCYQTLDRERSQLRLLPVGLYNNYFYETISHKLSWSLPALLCTLY